MRVRDPSALATSRPSSEALAAGPPASPDGVSSKAAAFAKPETGGADGAGGVEAQPASRIEASGNTTATAGRIFMPGHIGTARRD